MAAKKKSPDAPGGEMARKIWLAGIGAYGRAFSEAQESLARVGDETSKMFDDLVERGEEIEDTVESRGREIAERVRKPKHSFDDRIQEMRDRLQRNMGGGDDDRFEVLEARLSSIEEKLDALIAGNAKPAKRKTTKKSTKKSAR